MTIPLKTYVLCIAVFSACQAQNMLEKAATVGKNITIPCGVQVKGNLTRLVWKRGDVTRTENMAHMYDGVRQCDVTQKQNCFLRQDGSLELPNVQETDSGDYFCVVDDENYYSKHTLVVHPEVAFEGCPNPDVVSVTRVGPDMKILTYTSPECKNADVVGIVSCHPPSGAKVGMNVTEINCTCTHSGKMTDICVIPIPDASPSFEDDSELEAFCPVFPWFFGGIAIGIGLGVLATSIVVLLLHKRNKFIPTKPEFTSLPKQLTVDIGKSLELKCQVEGHPIPTPYWYKDGKQLDPQAGYKTTFSEGVATLTISNAKEGDKGMFSCVAVNSAGDAITSCNVVVEESTVVVQLFDHATSNNVEGSSHPLEGDSLVTDSGQPFGNPNESGSTAADVPVTAHQETTQNDAGELEMEPLMGETETDGQPGDTRQQHVQQGTAVPTEEETDGQSKETSQTHYQVQPRIALKTPQEETDGQSKETSQTHYQVQPPIPLKTPQASRRQRPISAIKVTTNPEYPGQDVQSDDKAVTMKELMLDFQSGPRITLLPLNEILPYGLEIRSPSKEGFKVIRKSEENYDVPLVCRKDGHHWDIYPGDQSDFYVSCGHCNKGCLLVGISGGEQNLKEIKE